MVTIGTLLTTAIFAEQTGDDTLHRELQMIYRALRLPMTYPQLAAIGIRREHITEALQELTETDCLYARFSVEKLAAHIDEIYRY